jgi:hypothetical protein
MRIGSWLLVALLTGVCGCLGRWSEESILPKPPKALSGPLALQGISGKDAIRLEVSLLEFTPGDTYPNEEIWTLADESGQNLEKRAILDENGFRVATLGGQIPSELHRVIHSKRINPEPRAVQMRLGHSKQLQLGASYSECALDLVREGRSTTREYLRASLLLEVTPEEAEGNRIKLRVIPTVRHGEVEMEPKPVVHPSGYRHFEIIPRHNEDTLGWMGFDLNLASGEYGIIGCRLGHPESLGQMSFLNQQTQSPVQRLLLLRAVRHIGSTEESLEHDGPLPIASQAAGVTRSAP